jgi:hypothetical protein
MNARDGGVRFQARESNVLVGERRNQQRTPAAGAFADRRGARGSDEVQTREVSTMAKRRPKRRFQVCASLDNLELARTGSAVRLEIESRGEKLGELHIGRGSLFWWGAHRKIRKRVQWAKFAEMLNTLAYGEDRGKTR